MEKFSGFFLKATAVSKTILQKPNDIIKLLIDSLQNPPIGQTKSFIWLVTPIGIAALCKEKTSTHIPPYDIAIKEGIEVSIDLSREEREFHQTEQGLILLFYS